MSQQKTHLDVTNSVLSEGGFTSARRSGAGYLVSRYHGKTFVWDVSVPFNIVKNDLNITGYARVLKQAGYEVRAIPYRVGNFLAHYLEVRAPVARKG